MVSADTDVVDELPTRPPRSPLSAAQSEPRRSLCSSLTQSLMPIDSNHFAEQLTFQDKRLFQHICAHPCLGSVWSTRYQATSKETGAVTSVSPSSPHVYSSSSPLSSSLSTSTSSDTVAVVPAAI